ncbi:MAG TPA: sigma-70 family RNA polymerase sigma factor [Pseudomonadota bacterium]|nr:sigma-70 family RNA polymerase sigma factor [Xanthomonadales bacterium]HQW63189.1 sigma-70 family RNA polymerase sigma factor [Pseudomonadota bacterium]MBP8177340.1 sigma-70 family RNA polymerase sigma factor [Xanthomonadales bacterium]HQX24118.1 sigma-70 family RNA polymerase sigma factor [Pseudomonadota bacterium]HQY36108.1 sigma-70 family RNA polymerase sigma factor [Pseudomonadota bacterium]
MSGPHPDVTAWLAALEGGERAAADALFPLVYAQLREIARGRLAGERSNHTLTPTALVHEAYLRLVGSATPRYAGTRHFLAIAAIAMRRILIDHARGVLRDKRGGGQFAVTLPDDLPGETLDPAGLIELDAALERLAAHDAEMARVVELRYFGGLTVEETAEALDLAPRTVNRHWTAARAWLRRELGGT